MHLATRNAQDFFLPAHCPTVPPCYLRRDPSSRRTWRSLPCSCAFAVSALAAWQRGQGSRWGVVQLVGHLTVNEDGEGSNPSAPANSLALPFSRGISPWLSASPLAPSPSNRHPSTPRSCNPSFANYPQPAPTGTLRRNIKSLSRSSPEPVARYLSR
jgi:hypothetical protein